MPHTDIKDILAPILSNALLYGMVKESVCFPYEFTLLSNNSGLISFLYPVCFPYEFTLLSNYEVILCMVFQVCFPYEFTLL
ncbi:MAG: hypothetical protein EGP96_05920, partial [Roseburia inulinivorans]|nr:hypothetical protein [Roseburia inulinivorans]